MRLKRISISYAVVAPFWALLVRGLKGHIPWVTAHEGTLYIAFGLLCVPLFLLSMWGQIFEPTNKPDTYISALDAVRYIAVRSKWGRAMRQKRVPFEDHFGRTGYMYKNPMFEAVVEFSEQAQREGTPLKVFGHREDDPNGTAIPHTFWMSNIIDEATLFEPGEESRTQAKSPRLSNRPYYDLKIEEKGVKRVWSRTPWWLRVRDAIFERGDEFGGEPMRPQKRSGRTQEELAEAQPPLQIEGEEESVRKVG